MTAKIVFQTDRAGLYAGLVEADESPLEPGVFLIPAGAVEIPPPQGWDDEVWPRWNGAQWILVKKPRQPVAVENPLARLQAFLSANPDIAALVSARNT